MNKLEIFESKDFGKIRTIIKNDKVFFVAKDICEILALSNITETLKRMDEDELSTTEVIDSIGRKQETYIVNESGLYNLIFQSRKETAKLFRKWITGEVLPSIRKTGGYINNDDLFINTYLPNADETTKMLFKTTLENVRSLNTKLEKDKPKVLFADSVETSKSSILIGELAKLLKQNGINIGQNRLFDWLRYNGYLGNKGEYRNLPTQKSMQLGLFEIKKRTIDGADGIIRTISTTKVTGKGQIYFTNKFLKSE